MAFAFPLRWLPSKSVAACAAIAIGSALVPSAASAQDIVADVLTVPFGIVAAPFVAADEIVNGPYYRYPAYRYRYAPAYYDYAPAYGASCGYDRWGRWVCVRY
jgi:hypothetical protein